MSSPQLGEQLTPDVAKPETKLPKFGVPLLPLLGAVLLSVGPFLIWVHRGSFSAQGLDTAQATALYALGALVFVVTVTARGNDRRLSAALIFVGALSLALVFHFVYVVFDQGVGWGHIREGFYVTGGGAFYTTLAGCPLFRRLVI